MPWSDAKGLDITVETEETFNAYVKVRFPLPQHYLCAYHLIRNTQKRRHSRPLDFLIIIA
jgi:hypothetical protein